MTKNEESVMQNAQAMVEAFHRTFDIVVNRATDAGDVYARYATGAGAGEGRHPGGDRKRQQPRACQCLTSRHRHVTDSMSA